MNTCPKCGAKQATVHLLFKQPCVFACDTEILVSGEVYEARQCLRNQLAQRDAMIERLSREWTYLRAACQYLVDHHADQPIEEVARYAAEMMAECDTLEVAKADDE